MDAIGRAHRVGIDHALRARRGPRGRLRRAVALVGGGPRGLLGRGLGVLRRAGLHAVRARAGAPRDARRAVVPRGRGCPTPSTSSAAATTTRWPSATPASCASCRSGRGASCASRPLASPPGCERSGWARATASRPTCPTSPRRSRPSSPRASIGAVWSSAAPEFGARSVIDRFAQIEPKVLLAVDGYRYGGRDHDRSEAVGGHRRRDRRRGGALRLPGRQRLAD